MFSGIIEATAPALKIHSAPHLIRLALKRPPAFQALKEGESVSVDGVCLTLESFDSEKMAFGLGPETLKITGWTEKSLKGRLFNLERSLTLQKPLGGHFVTGHADGLARAGKIQSLGESRLARIKIPEDFACFFWKKSYIALNGASLTVNQAEGPWLEVCLIPQTLKLTNLSLLKEGESLIFEADCMTRPLARALQALRP